MRASLPHAAAVFAATSLCTFAIGGCSDAARTTTPTVRVASVASFDRGGSGNDDQDNQGNDDRRVKIFDGCDPATFNAPPGPGPGTCAPHNGPTVTFATFIAQLTAMGVAPNWKFAPPQLSAEHAQTIQAVNVGGEVHTFTRVAAFGGGIVPPLNALSHNPTEAPECKTLEADDFVAPGGTYSAPLGAHDKTVLFQCCIHPWMRSVVKADHD
jgi:hypothetical protein